MVRVVVAHRVSSTFAEHLTGQRVFRVSPTSHDLATATVSIDGGPWRPVTFTERMAMLSVWEVVARQLSTCRAAQEDIAIDVRSLRPLGHGVDKPGVGRLHGNGPEADVCGELLSTATVLPDADGECTALAFYRAVLARFETARALSRPWWAAALWLWARPSPGARDTVAVTTLAGASAAMIGAAHVCVAVVGYVAAPMSPAARCVVQGSNGSFVLGSPYPSVRWAMRPGGRCVNCEVASDDVAIMRAVTQAGVVVVMCGDVPARLPERSRARRVATSALLSAVADDRNELVPGDPNATMNLPTDACRSVNTYTEVRGNRQATVLAWRPIRADALGAAIRMAALALEPHAAVRIYGDGDALDSLPHVLHLAMGLYVTGVV